MTFVELGERLAGARDFHFTRLGIMEWRSVANSKSQSVAPPTTNFELP